ncbi:transglycosylase family protein [Streptomyces sp. ADMS]|nr:transglycosylase family protein [Streptomyces sp. ADMS]MDW4906004.1 transglycosylase family protein [Streptomyces sp. ADMS]
MTGSAIAIPLLGATGASAASGTTWDRVAECESATSWSANTGNGFYGGLQLTQADWERYGGLTYAPSADQASRSQQIAVAENILADQGAGAWEACALLSGLGKDTSSADVDTGVAEGDASGAASESDADSSSSSSSSSTSTAASPTPSASPSTDSSVSTKASESSPSPSQSVAATTDSAESAASPSPASSSLDVDNSQESDSSPTESVSGAEVGSSGQSAGIGVGGEAEGSYTVRAGDTLWSIADSLGLAGGWSELYTENERSLGADPNLILPGQTLAVGDEPGQR